MAMEVAWVRLPWLAVPVTGWLAAARAASTLVSANEPCGRSSAGPIRPPVLDMALPAWVPSTSGGSLPPALKLTRARSMAGQLSPPVKNKEVCNVAVAAFCPTTRSSARELGIMRSVVVHRPPGPE